MNNKILKRVEISEERLSGGYFSVFPCNIVQNGEKDDYELAYEFNKGFHLEELATEFYLEDTLCKYIDTSIHAKIREKYDDLNWDPWGHNVYSYNTIKFVIDDLKNIMKQLKENKLIPEGYLKDDESNILVAIDFYDRFLPRLSKLLLDNPECDYISFEGP